MQPPFTLAFDAFWNWLMSHPNCILRAGTPEAVIYDDDDLHWHFASYEDSTLIVQVLHGKRVLGEIFLDPEHVSYVQGVMGEAEGEHVFELISETENDRVATLFFVLAHGFDDDGAVIPGRVH